MRPASRVIVTSTVATSNSGRLSEVSLMSSCLNGLRVPSSERRPNRTPLFCLRCGSLHDDCQIACTEYHDTDCGRTVFQLEEDEPNNHITRSMVSNPEPLEEVRRISGAFNGTSDGMTYFQSGRFQQFTADNQDIMTASARFTSYGLANEAVQRETPAIPTGVGMTDAESTRFNIDRRRWSCSSDHCGHVLASTSPSDEDLSSITHFASFTQHLHDGGIDTRQPPSHANRFAVSDVNTQLESDAAMCTSPKSLGTIQDAHPPFPLMMEPKYDDDGVAPRFRFYGDVVPNASLTSPSVEPISSPTQPTNFRFFADQYANAEASEIVPFYSPLELSGDVRTANLNFHDQNPNLLSRR